MLPQSETLHGDIAQVTPFFAGSSFTMATISGCVCPKSTVAFGTVTVTEIAFTVMVIEPCATESATEVAVTVTVKSEGDGGVPGAV